MQDNTIEPKRKGKFIVFEGGEGSGKDTNIDQLKKEYAGNADIVFTREPGGTTLGDSIRGILLADTLSPMDVKAELLLFLSARAQLIEEVIKPALEAGKTVVSNRFGLSTIAYQIYGRERQEYLQFLLTVSEFVVGAWKPDAYILLDIPPEIGLARVARRKDVMNRFDKEKVTFHTRVREGYKKHVGDVGTPHIIDASLDFEEVYKKVHTVFEQYYQ